MTRVGSASLTAPDCHRPRPRAAIARLRGWRAGCAASECLIATTTALTYLRISANRTSEHASIEQQRADCTALAARLGYVRTVEFVDEAVSAYQDRARPAYQQLLRQLEGSEAGTVVVWHLDRLYRKPRELEQLLDLLDVRPIRVESVQGGSFDLNRHEGRLFARQLVAFANYESAHKGARVARAQQQRATRGLLHGGRHYGYLDNGTLYPPEAWTLRRIVDSYLAGLSVALIARQLTHAGIPAPAGGTSWGATTVRAILTSSRLPAQRGAHQGRWERAITPDESALIRAIPLGPRRDATRSSATLLGAMARCGRCGNRLVSAVTSKGQRVYRCRAQSTSCGRVAADMQRTDRAVISEVARLQSSASTRLPVCTPATLLAMLTAASTETITAAEQYGAGKITHEVFLRRRRRSTSIIAEADTDLRRHLRVKLLRQHPDAASTIDVLAVGHQRTIIDAPVSCLTIQPGRPSESFDSRIELRPRA